uniref:Putative secreted protein n=1 Tax=Anopheles triannulatus TaxID=58253 RepID=A0A2M4B6N6_9DIPT
MLIYCKLVGWLLMGARRTPSAISLMVYYCYCSCREVEEEETGYSTLLFSVELLLYDSPYQGCTLCYQL